MHRRSAVAAGFLARAAGAGDLCRHNAGGYGDHAVADDHQYRGEGLAEGDRYEVRIVTKDISRENGTDLNRREEVAKPATVADGVLRTQVGNMRKFTSIEFVKLD